MDRHKSRLLLLIPELQLGGAARVVRDHADALASHFTLQEVVFDNVHSMDFAGEREVLGLDRRRARGPLRPFTNLARRALRLRQIKRARSTEITISHLDGAHRVSILSGGRDAKILVIHGTLSHDKSLRGTKGLVARRLLIPFLYNCADRLVVVSRDLIDELVSLGIAREKITTINNMLDIGAVGASACEPLPEAEQAIFRGAPTLVTVSRLHEAKNPLRLLDVFAGLVRLRRARLALIGDGPLDEAAIAKAESLGLRTFVAGRRDRLEMDHDVYFIGRRTNPFPYLKSADLFLLPSLWEGFPLALCEALACGAPTIAADCPTGPREILAPATRRPDRPIQRPEYGEFGVLMPQLDNSKSAGIWVQTLDKLLGDETLRAQFSRAGMRRAQDFSTEHILPQWLKLIGEVLGARDQRASASFTTAW